MFRKYCLVPALIAIAGVFIGSETAMAQHGGHGGHGGGHASHSVGHAGVSHAAAPHAGVSHAAAPHVGVAHANPGHAGAVYHGGRVYGRGGYGYGRGGYGYGRGGYGYWGGLGWWPGYYGYWPNYDGPDSHSEAPAYPDYYGPDVAPYANPAPTPVSTAADIRVIVPDPTARVWFDGSLTNQTGTDRRFHSPSLPTTATYHVKAAWMQDGHEVMQERDVPVSPGQAVMVDFAHSPVSTSN